VCTVHDYKKDDAIIKHGGFCRVIGFLNKGLIRVGSAKLDKEVTTCGFINTKFMIKKLTVLTFCVYIIVKPKNFIISSLFVNALFKWKHAHKNTFVALTKLLLEEAIDPMDKGKRLFFFTNCP